MKKLLVLALLLTSASALAGEPTKLQCEFSILNKRTGARVSEIMVDRLRTAYGSALATVFLTDQQLAMRAQVSIRTSGSQVPRFELDIYEDDYVTKLATSDSDGVQANVVWESRDQKASIACRLVE
jgi:hypothetical protein